jgi:hypothetical protein
MPSSTVIVLSRGCLPASGGCCGEPSDQSPSCCRSSSAFGPTTAIAFSFAGSSGRSQLAALHRLDGAFVELRRRHDEVVAGADRHRGRVGVGRRDLLLVHEAADVVPVGHQHAREAPLVLEDLAE